MEIAAPRPLAPMSRPLRRALEEFNASPHLDQMFEAAQYAADIKDPTSFEANALEYTRHEVLALYRQATSHDDLVHLSLAWFDGQIPLTPWYYGTALDPGHDATLTNLKRLHREYRILSINGQGSTWVEGTRTRPYLEAFIPREDLLFWLAVLRQTHLWYYLTRRRPDADDRYEVYTNYYQDADTNTLAVTQVRAHEQHTRNRPWTDYSNIHFTPDSFEDALHAGAEVDSMVQQQCFYMVLVEPEWGGPAIEATLLQRRRQPRASGRVPIVF